MSKDFFAGSLIGFVVMLWLVSSPWSDNAKYRNAIKECEKTLPRDQQCKVIGVPDYGNK